MVPMEILLTKITEYFAVPSLEYQALLRIVAGLWNRENARNGIWFSLHSSVFEYFNQFMSVIRNDINHLPLPTKSKKELFHFSEGIALEMFRWNVHHNENYNLNIIIPNNICWKPLGTLNYEETAKLLIQNSTLPVFTRFYLSCMYGLEDSIKELWNAIPIYQRSLLRSEMYFVYYWLNVLTLDTSSPWNGYREIRQMENLTIDVFRTSIYRRDIFVSDYIIKKIKPENKLNKLLITEFKNTTTRIYKFFPRMSCMVKFPYSDIFCWLFHKLEKKQQQKMLMKHPFPVLLCYLEWPRQELFIEMAPYMFKYLSGIHFGFLLKEIAYKVLHFKDFDYETLFGQFGRQSLVTHKEFAIGSNSCWSALYHLFMTSDRQNIELNFASTTVDQKKIILQSVWWKRIKTDLNRQGKNDLLNFLNN
ncbi:uncharacterized protein NPIL_540121 [Nephila pilipes]|uniref:Uncharacterized protein n=1 Tax=Nephila pilipes TaxID=299642 RepID=A0A8X6TC42_NEPPI|nr:uncharacterized protein NPIL_540121 [Nephila pilipes]